MTGASKSTAVNVIFFLLKRAKTASEIISDFQRLSIYLFSSVHPALNTYHRRYLSS